MGEWGEVVGGGNLRGKFKELGASERRGRGWVVTSQNKTQKLERKYQSISECMTKKGLN